MILAIRCPACGDELTAETAVNCEDCGNAFHESCADYERTFECPSCANEPWIGAVEF